MVLCGIHKNLDVVGRQFKEASRLAGESKVMTLHVEEEERSLSEAEQAMAVSNKNLALLSDELNVLRDEVSQLERKEGECYSSRPGQFQMSLLQMKHIFKTYSRPIILSAT